MSKLVRVIEWLLNFVIFLLVLRYGGDFSWRQAVAASLLFAALVVEANLALQRWEGQRRRRQVFSPYRVTIRPNLHKILLDYKLLRTDEEFRQAWQIGLKGSLLINFTALQADNEADFPGLVFWDTQKCFVSEAAFEEPVKGIGFRGPMEDGYPDIVIEGGDQEHHSFDFRLPPEIYFTWVGRAGRG